MKSSLPKVVHSIAGLPMAQRVINTAQSLDQATMHIVVGHGADTVKNTLVGEDLRWYLQAEQLGTGHAVMQALPGLKDQTGITLILYGDVPLTKKETLAKLMSEVQDKDLVLLTLEMEDPTGYGRIVRASDNSVQAIVEHKDATSEQHQIKEINTGIMAVKTELLAQWLPNLSNDNVQKEYYLTDLVAMAVAEGKVVSATQPDFAWEVEGVNSRVQLAALERIYQQVQAESLLINGVTLRDPSRIDLRGDISCGKDVTIDVNVVLEGSVTIEDEVVIDSNCIIKNSVIRKGTHIKANSMIEESVVGENCDIGPFARLRPGTVLASKAKIGNFVETKKTSIGEGSKVNHLSYVGDANVGSGVNIGAGTITCNYDGVNKFKTEIEDDVFIGSNTCLVAPVKVGKGSTTGAGSIITKEVNEGELAVARSRQKNISTWNRPVKNK
ncbi:bifunctional UDP-N-acetylglucosamine diphosphorylase/glucosamine-1-phosphate N-acetyltransferase GlmU [Litoribacillus peritrichatus]|uniref:Bifunctional protein GlmU n=2 Tax=Litoribacillus peritrichatus TaxID=718191 RepID=A0ABP7MM85_9GAMM